MTRLLLLLTLILGLSSAALAQTPVEAGKAFTLAASHDGTNVTGYRMYLDGAQVGSDLPASASVNGVVSSPTLPGLTVGTHTLQVGAFNPLGEVKSVVLSVAAMTLPTAPTNLKFTITVTIAANGVPTITATTAERIQ